MGRYVDLDVADDVIGIAALRKIAAKGPLRQQLGVILDGDEPEKPGFTWHDIHKGGRKIGDLTNCAWSYRLKKNIGFGLVTASALPGEPVTVEMHGRMVSGTLCELPFL
jgi:aminomethyltransferase